MHGDMALTTTGNAPAVGLPDNATVWRRRNDQVLQLRYPGESEAQQVGELADIFARFLRLRVADGDASPATIYTHHTQAAQFVAWCQGRGLQPACPGRIFSSAAILAKQDVEWPRTGQTRGRESTRFRPE